MTTFNRAEASKASTFSPFNSFAKAFKIPSFDFDAVQGIQRRNIEALTAAGQTVVQGVQTIVQRQGEITRQSVEQFRGLLSVTPSDALAEQNLVKQIDLVKAAFEKNVADVRELQTIAAKVTSEAADILSRRVVASLDEVKTVTYSKAA